ncbi:MAG: hypothetical protein JWM84_1477 [Nocardioides sp.]|jgi:hypothetical protein|nr:hypothetical protein [Nocardioides sp.]
MTTLRLPPVVYAPTMVDDDGTTRVKMHTLADSRVALFVFSAIDRLEAQYGEGAPWVLLQAPQLQQAHDSAPFDLLLVDRVLHPEEAGR